MGTIYGQPPTAIAEFDLEWTELMHYLYLPVVVDGEFAMPRRLEFARDLVGTTLVTEQFEYGNHWRYVYVTAHRGFATPGNPLNRPGWHSDGFGTPDINYVWTDRFPTLFAEQPFTDISTDHVRSAQQFEEQIDPACIRTYPDRLLQRLDSSVIHAAPEIPAPGGLRSFLKVSFSNERYNLVGNSHNHDLDYTWPMYSREDIRNDPARAESDSVKDA
ncbi:hypothetical protein MN032_10910 [Agromyces atrinae]|uniref:hypothetical protein n=1 Tax=Agromyces atrinae TaxID=592376 RepID=UPI001F5AEB7C|nr:hypothetical protein [Agromyces atrinae]MCI2958207.1 hypothetical protein [Agromyces atrinae]